MDQTSIYTFLALDVSELRAIERSIYLNNPDSPLRYLRGLALSRLNVAVARTKLWKSMTG